MSDLKGKIVCVQKGSTGYDALKCSNISSQVSDIIELENMVNCLNEVELFKSDATVVDELIAKYYLKELNNKFKILDEEISSEYYVVGLRKGNDKLKSFIESRISDLNFDGETNKISEKWFGSNMFFWEQPSYNTEINNKKYDFSIIISLFYGLLNTLSIFSVVMLVSIPLGILVYILQDTKNIFLKLLFRRYIDLMRCTPLLLQLFFIFYAMPYIPYIGIYLTINNRFLASLIAFILNYTAYFAEIFRGGFSSIGNGQSEAARVLGFNKIQAFFKILLPQSLKSVLPAICNESVTLIKDTSLVFAIGLQELLSITKNIVNSTANILPYLFTFCIYLVICTGIVFVFGKIEKSIKF